MFSNQVDFWRGLNTINLTDEWFCYAGIPGSYIACSFLLRWRFIKNNNNSQVEKNREFHEIYRQIKVIKTAHLLPSEGPQRLPFLEKIGRLHKMQTPRPA